MRRGVYKVAFGVVVLMCWANVVMTQVGRRSFRRTDSEKIFYQKNEGQIIDTDNNLRPDILYQVKGRNGSFYIRKTGVSYVQLKTEGKEKILPEDSSKDILRKDSTGVTKVHRIDIEFAGAVEPVNLIETGASGRLNNFYLGHCPDGILNVKSYQKVRLKNIYKGIDVVHYSNNGQLEYDLLVAPGANPSQIKMKVKGADNWKINEVGNLEIKTSLGVLIEKAPVVLQGDKVIPSSYTIEKGFLKFDIGKYDPTLELRIDPIREWATYLGGTTDEWYWGDVATDANGNVFVSGTTLSNNFPVTTGAFQSANGTAFGGYDAYLTKFTSSGTQLWSTYYGGGNHERNWGGVATDNNGNVFFHGSTLSNNFPVSAGAFQTVFSSYWSLSESEAYLVKFSGNGVRLWGTFIGGDEEDEGRGGIVTDQVGNVYLSGSTKSYASFPVTTGAYQTASGGGKDAYLMKFSGAGNLVWSTFFGGNGEDRGAGRPAIDANGDLYFCGSTNSSNLPVTTGAYQSVSGGARDAYITKFTSSGNPIWTSYYGGNGWEVDWGMGVATDQLGNVFLHGTTKSGNFPVTTGAFQTTLGGNDDAYLVKFSGTGTRLWATYFGGTGNDWGTGGVVTDASGNVYIHGETSGGNSLVTTGAFQTSFGGMRDVYLSKFSGAGTHLWGTFYGGVQPDLGWGGIALDNMGSLYIHGITLSNNFPVTAGAFQTSLSGGYDSYLVKFSLAYIEHTNTCQFDSIAFNLSDTVGVSSVLWNFGDPQSGTANSSTSFFPHHVYNTFGQFPVSCEVFRAQGQIDTLYDTVVIHQTPIVDLGSDTILCEGDSILLQLADTNFSYLWNTGDAINQIPVNLAGTYWVTVTSLFCGTATDTIIIDSLIPALVDLPPDTIMCIGDTLLLDAIIQSGVYSWNTGTTDSIYAVASSGIYAVTATNLCGTDSDTSIVQFIAPPLVNLGNDTTLCQGDSIVLVTSADLASYQWNTGQTDSLLKVGTGGIYQVTLSNVCGTIADSIEISIDSTLVVDLGPDTVICKGSTIWLTSNVEGDTYIWNNGSTNDSLLVTQQGQYGLTVGNACGTFGDYIVVSYDTNPITYLGPDSTYCLTNLIQLDAFWSRANYHWNTGDTTASITAGYTGNYSVKVTNLCGFDKDTVTISYDMPIQFDLGKDRPLCDGDSFSVGAMAHNAEWLWNNGMTDSAIVINQPGMYWVEASNHCGNYRDSLWVLHFTLPETSNNPKDTTVCIGEEVEIEIPKNNSTQIKWIDNLAFSYIRNLTNAGVYQYVLSNFCGSSTDSFRLIYEEPVLLNLGEDTVLCAGEVMTKELNYPNSTYLWDDGSTENKRSIIYTGMYNVTVKTAAGCESYDEINVLPCKARIYVPNAFTPDNDNLNNTFKVIGNELERFSILIYDRWGNEVFQSNDITRSWDGTYKGTPALMGVYTYMIHYGSGNESLEKYGTVTLIR